MQKTSLLLKIAIGNPYVNRIGFFSFCVYKNVSQKNWFLYMNENYDDYHRRKTTHKNQNNCETFLYTKSHTLFIKLDNSGYVFIYKKPYTWRYGIFMKFLMLASIYKKHDTSQKARQFALRFYIQKSGTFALRDFHWIFEICGGGRYLLI